MDLQAQDRVHRIGQTKPVLIFRLSTANTAESRMLACAASKRRLERLVIHKSNLSQCHTDSHRKIQGKAATTGNR
jgi:ATP-dependent DNA helicase